LKNKAIRREPHSVCIAGNSGLVKVGNEILLPHSIIDFFKREYALGRNTGLVMMSQNLKKGGDKLINKWLKDRRESMRKAVDHINEFISHSAYNGLTKTEY
jgi:hypothetical protein